MSAASLLPPSSTGLEHATAKVLAGRASLPVRISDLWNPGTCPPEQLPWLAWARSVDNWPAHWGEARRRQAIADSYLVHRHKGTAFAVKQTVNQFGGNILLREWWQLDPPGPPHTFELVLNIAEQNGEAASSSLVNEVIAAVNRIKPVRSHFTFTLGLTGQAHLHLAAGAIGATYRRLNLSEALPHFTHTLPLVPAARVVSAVRLALTEA